MIGLKMAGVCLVLTLTGMFINYSMKRQEPSWEMSKGFALLAAVAFVGIPVGLILAIIGV